ncbi:MAG: hypothetical protein ABI970_21665 [Chloroflexota bacterium]
MTRTSVMVMLGEPSAAQNTVCPAVICTFSGLTGGHEEGRTIV